MKRSAFEIKEILQIPHQWDELKKGDMIILLPSEYIDEEFFTPGQKYKIEELLTVTDDPRENKIGIKANNGQVFMLPYSDFNVTIESSLD